MNRTGLNNKIDYIWSKNRIKQSFFEKDVYITEILRTLSSLKNDKIVPVFFGGTSLHKGHQIIKRFSEDINFRVKTTLEITRNDRRNYRNYIINEINKIQDIKVIEEPEWHQEYLDLIQSRNESNFFGFYVDYPKEYNLDKSLRSNIKFEMDFEKLNLEPKNCEIDSMVNLFTKNKRENKFNMNCIALEEIAGNKLSALMWRVQIKDRSQPFGIKNDPTIIRHLHDLSALSSQVLTDDFINMLRISFNNNLGRSGSRKDISLNDSLINTFNSLKNDKMYKKEYENFVFNMCYGRDEEIITFKTALGNFEKIMNFILSNQISN